METRKELEEKLEEFRRQREAAERAAQEFCQEHISKLEQNFFDAITFLDGLRKLDERTFEFAIEFLIRENKSLWHNFSADELKTFVEYVITTKWFEQNKPFSDNWKRDFFDAVANNANAVNILSSIYKNIATTNLEASRYITNELAGSENGRAELLNILGIDDAGVQHMALHALAEHCVMSGIYPADVRDRNPLYIDTIRNFLFHPDEKLSNTAVKALHRGELLRLDEVIKLMEIGGDIRTFVGELIETFIN